MARKINWESQIGSRLRLRDLHVFSTVVERGSMAKAAERLGISQPAVSEVVADLEHQLSVKLLDRGPRGVEPTIYGRTLLKRSLAAFDELKQGIKDIEFLADPTSGDISIGCPESLAASILPPVIQQFSQRYPGVALEIKSVASPALDLPELRERRLDIVIERMSRPLVVDGDDLNVEILFHDNLIVAAGAQSRWAKRDKIDLAELVNERWILAPAHSWGEKTMAQAFRARDLDLPRRRVTTFSVHLRNYLLATGDYITALPKSVLAVHADRFSLKMLPVDLPVRPWPVVVATLRGRTLSPVAQRFVEQLRVVAKSLAGEPLPERTDKTLAEVAHA